MNPTRLAFSMEERVVFADQAALERISREHEPLDWAFAQVQLGGALCRLGERASCAKSLELAVCAYQAALEVRTRESDPLDWASTKDHLGTALLMLGELTPGAKRLKKAVCAFQAALEELHREDVSMLRALTLYNLGNALSKLGERTGKSKLLCAALDKHLLAWEMFKNTPHYADLARNGVLKDLKLLNSGVLNVLSAKALKKCKERRQSALRHLQNSNGRSTPLDPWFRGFSGIPVFFDV